MVMRRAFSRNGLLAVVAASAAAATFPSALGCASASQGHDEQAGEGPGAGEDPGADGGPGTDNRSGGGGSSSSSSLPPSRLIGGATLDAKAFWPPTGQVCEAKLDPAGTVPTSPPQAFVDECAGCHGPTGAGHGKYSSILGARSFDGFQRIVRSGLMASTGEMPFFKPAWLNDDDLRRIYGFVTASPILETHVCTPRTAMSPAEITEASTRGMATWRTSDGKTDPAGITTNVACVNCHAPDPLDIAYFGFPDGDILRRAIPHLSAAQVANIIDMVHALRDQYSIGRRDPRQVRPFQPGGGLLAGGSIAERDATFGQELVSMGLAIATKSIASVADAEAAFAEVWAIDRHMLRIPVPFNRYSEDIFHNPDGYMPDCSADLDGCDDHGSIADWVSVAPHIPKNAKDFFKRADTYLANPTDANFKDLEYSSGQDTVMPGTYDQGTDIDQKKYQSLVLANYCLRLELSGGPGCYDQGVAPFPNKASAWDIGAAVNLYGTGFARWPACDKTWKGCADEPAKLPSWPSHLLDDITPGATLSSNFSRLRHPWMTLWWTHFDPTLLVTGDPTAQKDEYFTRSLFWSNNNDWIFDGSPAGSARPTYSIFAAYEVLMHNVATLENPGMASCSLWPATDFPCTSVDVRSGYYPNVINFAEQNQPNQPESVNNVHYQTLFQPQDSARRANYQMLVANLYRVFFWKLIGALQKDNWMCDRDLQSLRIARAQQFLNQAETQASNANADKAMFDRLGALMASSRKSCPPL